MVRSLKPVPTIRACAFVQSQRCAGDTLISRVFLFCLNPWICQEFKSTHWRFTFFIYHGREAMGAGFFFMVGLPSPGRYPRPLCVWTKVFCSSLFGLAFLCVEKFVWFHVAVDETRCFCPGYFHRFLRGWIQHIISSSAVGGRGRGWPLLFWPLASGAQDGKEGPTLPHKCGEATYFWGMPSTVLNLISFSKDVRASRQMINILPYLKFLINPLINIRIPWKFAQLKAVCNWNAYSERTETSRFRYFFVGFDHIWITFPPGWYLSVVEIFVD